MVGQGFEHRIVHGTAIVKCLRRSVEGKYKDAKHRILDQELLEFRGALSSPGLHLWAGSKLLCLLVEIDL